MPRLPRLPELSLELRTAAGAAFSVVALASGVLAIQDIARLPLTFVVCIAGLAALWAFLSVIARQRREIDRLRSAIEAGSKDAEARLAFNDRIEEGNELARRLKRYKPAKGSGSPEVKADQALHTQAVVEWNERCVATARHYVPHLAGALGAPFAPPPARPPGGGVWIGEPWARNLRNEVTVKIDRLQKIQEAVGR
jgi:hypothetical protein